MQVGVCVRVRVCEAIDFSIRVKKEAGNLSG